MFCPTLTLQISSFFNAKCTHLYVITQVNRICFRHYVIRCDIKTAYLYCCTGI